MTIRSFDDQDSLGRVCTSFFEGVRWADAEGYAPDLQTGTSGLWTYTASWDFNQLLHAPGERQA